VDIARSERAERDLDATIERRHDARVKAEGHRPSQEMYEQSVRRYNAQRNAQRRAEWAAFHRQQAERHRATLTDLISHHLDAAERLDKESA
jgi:hypothetical protein